MTRWIFPQPIDSSEVKRFAGELGVARFAAELLMRRGLSSAMDAEHFLAPRLKSLRDPFLLPNMGLAAERILTAIDRRERIVLYGDYDVDGVTSLALLTRVLRAMGAEPACFLPSRADEGYGLSPDGVARCVSEHDPQLVIAVDCGTSSVAEIAALRAQGVDVIVCDHHECKDALPDCVALVNPKLGDDFHYLCSVGIAFKVAHALLKLRKANDFDLRECLDLVALGSVADLVPLRSENRIFVRNGLLQLAQSKWVGLRALVEVSGLSAPFSPGNIGFGLGPRLNAAGRLGTAQDALELLLTEDAGRARTLAATLDAQNRERRSVEEAVYQQAEAQLMELFDAARDAAIVVGAAGWHPGVVGIVASRLQKRHHRPTFVVGFDGAGIGKGSGRSIEGLSLVAALGRCSDFLEKHGGHEMAAGLTVREGHFAEFRQAFCACAREILTDEQLQPRLRVDAELTLGEIDYELLDQHESLQPFGMGNPHPLFAARGVTLAGEPRVMKEKHLSLILRQNGDEYRAVWFNSAAQELPRLPWDVAFQIERNEWQGTVSPQIHVRAVRRSE
ncbi:exonuclease RecJ [Chthoniobacter flavus]|uniref:single-stranded-DNA-specific exonuclease RecJ n=2 Tax=Chthoniobacter flavus TaxID=191863 RepID=UPI001046DB45|nr:single-stranded-DNA-specific exonuclease RecJ [Chthoniobacter flavus]TCO89273.1 exonuclease RecJ [Chthoniobacter flavus]